MRISKGVVTRCLTCVSIKDLRDGNIGYFVDFLLSFIELLLEKYQSRLNFDEVGEFGEIVEV